MKIYFDNVNFGSRTGPNTFAHRLANRLALSGHELADYDDYDVMLSIIEQTRQHLLGKKRVQRLDGIWFRPDEFLAKNINIKATYLDTDAVIWQSEFDKQMTQKWWGAPKRGVVIHNGIDKIDVKVDSETLLEIRQKYDTVFVCSSNWHPQKRLRSNIETFLHLLKTNPNSCLLVMGSNPNHQVSHQRIFYTHSLPPELYMQVYAIADWMIHLAWLDHCPNVVIEALSQGVPVICSEAGGTKEIVGTNGIILSEQKSYDFELTDYDNPPEIDATKIEELPEIKVDASHLDLSLVTQQYVDLFTSLIQN